MQRTILVTGTSSGIGAAVSARVRAAGDVVVSLSRSDPREPEERWVEVDLADTRSVPAAVEEAVELAPGPLDGVVLNAGLADRSTSQWTVAQIERHLRVNTVAPVAVWESLVRLGAVVPRCNVVLLGSVLQHGSPQQPAYAMSKAALWTWMRSHTMSQAPDSGPSMNMIWPGRVDTPGNPARELPAHDANLFRSSERIAGVILTYLYQPADGPRGTVVDLGRS